MKADSWKRLMLVAAGALAAEVVTRLGMALTGEGLAAMAAEREAVLASAPGEATALAAGAPEKLTALAAGAPAAPFRAETQSAQVVVHPYLGYVLDPEIREWRTPRGRIVRPAITPDGFAATPDPPDPPADVEVGLFGGSVAWFLCGDGRAALLDGLARSPVLRNRRLALRCFALGGYKQPQQLMTLAYLLALGRRLDIVINLDGFNEVALSFAENRPAGVFPFYPRGWSTLAEGIPDLQRQRLVGSIVGLEDQRASLARTFARFPLRHSAVCSLVWRALDRRLAARLGEAQATLQRTAPAGRTFRAHGPRWDHRGEDAFFRDVAAEWERTSFEMAHLCAAAGIRYYHFLQPNQYDPGSKPMSGAERRTAYRADHPYREGVEKGYPLLTAAGRDLLAGGVRFYDARRIFAGVTEPLYVDQCCHVRRHGSELLAAWMTARIVEDLRSNP